MRNSGERWCTLENESSYLEGLNAQQSRAVMHEEGPLLVLSAAGTGKTSVLTRRIVHLLKKGRAEPNGILSVTFTNKAAREMLERTRGMLGCEANLPWLGTFHAIGAKILRQDAHEALGVTPGFTILGVDDQTRLLKQLVAESNIDAGRWPVNLLLGLIDQWKNQGLTHVNLPETESSRFAGGRGRVLYAAYQARMRELNVADFGDLILGPLEFLRRGGDAREIYQRRFSHILVDEYQDTNGAQYQLLRLLVGKHRNVCCVGDDDQSIYSWRGSSVDHILRFEMDFPGAVIVRLEQNYRSAPLILASASHLIAHNKRRLEKRLWTDQKAGGLSHLRNAAANEEVVVTQYADGEEESVGVAQSISDFLLEGVQAKDLAVLVRTSFQARAFEEQFIKRGISYLVVGGPRFYERAEILDANAYLRLVLNGSDNLAFERVVNKPKRALGDAAVRNLREYAEGNNVSLMESARALLLSGQLRPLVRKNLGEFVQLVDAWAHLSKQVSLQDLLRRILDESGYIRVLKNSASAQDQLRFDNLQELLRSLANFKDPAEYLESAALASDLSQAQSEDCVKIMTLHSAKGLEFRVVYLPGWEEGIFPHQRALSEQQTSGLEEERRLAYVGLTRAQQQAFISHARRRYVHNCWQNNVPSRFLQELPKTGVKNLLSKNLLTPSPALETPLGSPESPDRPFQNRLSGEVRKSGGGFQPGQAVLHERFGRGRITGVDGHKLTVDFGGARRAVKVISTFVTPDGPTKQPGTQRPQLC